MHTTYTLPFGVLKAPKKKGRFKSFSFYWSKLYKTSMGYFSLEKCSINPFNPQLNNTLHETILPTSRFIFFPFDFPVQLESSQSGWQPHPNLTLTVFELESTDKGFLPPRLTTIQRNGIDKQTAPLGLMIYNLDRNEVQYLNEEISIDATGKRLVVRDWESATSGASLTRPDAPEATLNFGHWARRSILPL